MFWNRADLKQHAKITMQMNYWKCVLVSLVLAFCGGGSGINFNYGSSSDLNLQNGSGDIESQVNGIIHSSQFADIIGVFMGVFLLALLLSLALTIFLLQPLEVGCRRYFVIARVENANLGEMGYAFEHSYMNIVKAQFLRGLYTFLWSLLFVIPGVIKSYEYRMIPYILAEDPEISSADAFMLSKKMMDGDKMNAFVLDLSFIGSS